MAPLFIDAASLDGARDAHEALLDFDRLGWRWASVDEDLSAGAGWPGRLAAWEGRCWLVDRGPGPHPGPRWNLAATEEADRRAAVREALEALRESAGRGAACHVLRAGWACSQAGGQGEPVAWPKALDQLCRSLDALAALADARGIGVAIPTTLPDAGKRPVGGEPGALLEALDRLAAPPLGLLADPGPSLERAQRQDLDPAAALEVPPDRLSGLLITRVSGELGDPHHPLTALIRAAGALSRPIVLAPRGLPRARLTPLVAEAAEAWRAPEEAHKVQG